MYHEVYGRGGPPQVACRYSDMAAGTANLLDRLEIRGAARVGRSDGIIAALMIAVRRSDLVRRLVVWGASVVPGAAATPAA
jgi:pimeloyl-ACP methyl ester carboxylesterase